MGRMDLRKLPLPPPPPYPLQPSPARPRGRWGLGGQDVRAKAGGRWEGELKAQRPFTTTGRGLTAPAGAVLAAATTPQLLGIAGGYSRAGRASPPLLQTKGSMHMETGAGRRRGSNFHLGKDLGVT